MVSEYIKNLLATENGEDFAEKRYVDIVRELGKINYALEDEVAILRKMIYLLLNYISLVHPSIIDTEVYTEFMRYNNEYESIKTKAKTSLGLN